MRPSAAASITAIISFHEKGLIHNDLRVDNVILREVLTTAEGDVKIDKKAMVIDLATVSRSTSAADRRIDMARFACSWFKLVWDGQANWENNLATHSTIVDGIRALYPNDNTIKNTKANRTAISTSLNS